MHYYKSKYPQTRSFNNDLRCFVWLILACLYLSNNGKSQQFEIGTSPNPVGSGARAMGMGNAFIAVADDATASAWNPGGLSQLEKPEFSFAGEIISLREFLSSASNPEIRDTETLNLFDLNYASLVLPFYYKTNMVISFNFLKLFRFDKALQFNSVSSIQDAEEIKRERQFDFEQEGTFSVVAPAYGINLTEKLSLGFTWNIWNDSITQASAYEKKEITIDTTIFGDFPSESNVVVTSRFEVDDGDSFVIGGLYRFNKYWALGLVIKPSYTLDIRHHRLVISRYSDTEENDQVITDKTLDSEFEFPFILGTGIAWRPTDLVTISTDLTWTDWSDFTFKEEGKTTNPVSGRPLSEGKLDDTVTLRLGCEYLIVRDNYLVPLRWGIGYDPAPAVDSVDDFYTVNVGTGIQLFKRVNFDVAYEFRWGNDVNSDTFQGIDASEDIRQHRVLASMIYYF